MYEVLARFVCDWCKSEWSGKTNAGMSPAYVPPQWGYLMSGSNGDKEPADIEPNVEELVCTDCLVEFDRLRDARTGTLPPPNRRAIDLNR